MSTVDENAWIQVANAADISEDINMLRVAVEGEPVCLYRLDDGSIHATHDTCTHAEASLAGGYLEDGVIECPLHQGCFDIRTGKAVAAPCKVAVKVYPVKVDGGVVYVGRTTA